MFSVLKQKRLEANFKSFVEREGFEPPIPHSTPVFKTGAFNRSAISPEMQI